MPCPPNLGDVDVQDQQPDGARKWIPEKRYLCAHVASSVNVLPTMTKGTAPCLQSNYPTNFESESEPRRLDGAGGKGRRVATLATSKKKLRPWRALEIPHTPHIRRVNKGRKSMRRPGQGTHCLKRSFANSQPKTQRDRSWRPLPGQGPGGRAQLAYYYYFVSLLLMMLLARFQLPAPISCLLRNMQPRPRP